MRIISIRDSPSFKDTAIKYIQQSSKSVRPIIYEDSINHCIDARNDLPQWYFLEKDNKIIGCAGLITNDFISRGDLYPWVCGIYIDENHRGNAYGKILIDKAKSDTKKFRYQYLYLCTEHIGYYENYGFEYIGQGYHPWEAESRIYQIELK
jgi:N-acetylglutamate synthase-like GNAT family acetyltransferase